MLCFISIVNYQNTGSNIDLHFINGVYLERKRRFQMEILIVFFVILVVLGIIVAIIEAIVNIIKL